MNKTFVILTPGFPKDESDTTCLPFIQSFIKTLNESRYNIEIIVITLDYPFINEPYYWNGIKVIPCNHQNSKGIKRLSQLYYVYKELKSIHLKSNLSGILSLWGSYTSLVGHYFSTFNKIKHHCWLQGQDIKKGNNAFRFFKPAKGELIALSPAMRNEFQKNYDTIIDHCIPVAINTERFTQFKSVKDIDIIGVGSLIPLKQWEIFIRVIAAIAWHNPSIKCYLCGDGSEKEKLKHLIQKNNLTDNIFLTGEMPHDDVLKLMSRSKILLHTSAYEGYGSVFPESLYAGCYCISFVNPEQKQIDHWCIVENENEMIDKCVEVLQYPSSLFYPVLTCDMKTCVDDMMKIYRIEKTSIISSAIASKENLLLK